jgi:hypothetical protein
MEFFSLNSVDGVPSFKVNSTLQQALLVTKEKMVLPHCMLLKQKYRKRLYLIISMHLENFILTQNTIHR